MRSWIEVDYPRLVHAGASVVVSIWGTSVDATVRAAVEIERYTDAVAIEVNLSCPNSGNPHLLVSHDPGLIARQIGAISDSLLRIPVWAKLAPSAPDIVACAVAAIEAGATAVTLVNTLSAMKVDALAQTAVLSGVYGGLSGPPLHSIALRAIYQVRSARQDIPIVGVGGVVDGMTALEMLVVGAQAVQVGTACFADPRAPHKVWKQLARLMVDQSLSYESVVGSAVAVSPPHEYGTRVAGLASPDPPGTRRSRLDQPSRTPRRLRSVADIRSGRNDWTPRGSGTRPPH